MNETINILKDRKSVRKYEEVEIPEEMKNTILNAALRAPTAGNMMLYSIIDIQNPEIKTRLVTTCDDQPFIKEAPFVLMFLADYQRWYDYFISSQVPEMCSASGNQMRKPEEGDLLLACCDALIAAQSAVVAAEALGIGSCYIGDIMENYEIHKEMFDLPQYVFPITMVCFGYPTKGQKERKQPERFNREFILFPDKYRRLKAEEFDTMFKNEKRDAANTGSFIKNAQNVGQHMYLKKFSADFTVELNRSVREILKNWK